MASPHKNGAEIGRLDDAWFSESFRESGWILRNYGGGWERLGEKHENIHVTFAYCKRDFDAEPDVYKRFRFLVRRAFRLTQLGQAEAAFRQAVREINRGKPTAVAADFFLDVLQMRLPRASIKTSVSKETAQQILDLWVEYRIVMGEGVWAVRVWEPGFGTWVIVSMVCGSHTFRNRHRAMIGSMYPSQEIKMTPATYNETQLYLSSGNSIVRG